MARIDWAAWIAETRSGLVRRIALISLSVALGVIIVDQLTKWVILNVANFSPPGCLEAALDGFYSASCGQIPLSQTFKLTMMWNTGVSFGMLSANDVWGRVGLVVFALVLSAGLVVWLSRTTRPLLAIGLGLVLGGALGNVIDRALFGAVVDFFDFSGPWFGWEAPATFWPLSWMDHNLFRANGDGKIGIGFPFIFNVADVAINVGIACLVVDWVRQEAEARKKTDGAASAG